MRALASSDSRAALATRLASIASCARRRPSTAATRSAADPLGFDPDVAGLDVELGERLAHAIARGRGVLERVTQRRRGIDRGEHFAARRLDVGFEPFELAVRRVVGARTPTPAPPTARSRSALASSAASRRAASARRAGSRRASSAVELRRHMADPRLERLDLFAVERDLLFLTGDRELARVRGLARLRRRATRPRPARCAAARDRPRPRRRVPADTASRSRASASRARADSMVSASWRYLRANSTFSQRRSSSRSR